MIMYEHSTIPRQQKYPSMGAIAEPNMQAMSEEYEATYQRQPRCFDFDRIHLKSV